MAPLTENCTNLRLEGTFLHANCITADGADFVTSHLDLNPHIGNVNGVFTWGKSNFIASAVKSSLKLDGSKLSAQLYNSNGKEVSSTINLAERIRHVNGKLEFGPPQQSLPTPVSTPKLEAPPQVKKDTVPPAKKEEQVKKDTPPSPPSTASSLSSSAASLERSKSTTSTLVDSISEHHHHEHHESSFKSYASTVKSTKTVVREYTFSGSCHGAFQLKGTILIADCILDDGRSIRTSSIDLSKHIGNKNGKLVWGPTDFHLSSESYHIEGHFLVAKCKDHEGRIHISKLDLNAGLRNHNGIIVYALPPSSADLTEFFSTMPWVKFQVTATPDFSSLVHSETAKIAMRSVASTTVDHVVSAMTRTINIAIQEAIEEIKIKATAQMSLIMEAMLTSHTHHNVPLLPSSTEHSKMKLLHQLGLVVGPNGELKVKN